MKRNHKRIPHIMKGHKSRQHPSNFLFFDTETKDSFDGEGEGVERQQLWFGWIWAFRYENGKITRAAKARFNSSDEFFKLVASRLDKSRPLHIIAHNLGFDLTIVDFWNEVDRRGIECNYCVMADPPIFMSLTWKECRLVVIDTFNFWKCSVADMGKSLGIPKLDMPVKTKRIKDWDKYCIRDVEIIANQLTSLLDFLDEYDLGSFGISAPAIAMNCFRHKFMSHEIMIHDRVSVLQLERLCYYGGLVHNFYIGEVKGKKLYHTDVNSLYPSVMLEEYPVKLVESGKDMKVRDFKYNFNPIQCCAAVMIDDYQNAYSKRHEDRLCQVVGRYVTWLCGAELQRAADNNSIIHIVQYSLYDTSPIFAEFVKFFWKLRSTFKAQGDTVKEQMVKLFMNSLYGKFGMKGFDYVDFNQTHLASLYEMFGMVLPDCYKDPNYRPSISGNQFRFKPLGLPVTVDLRYVAGKLQIRMNTGEHTESFCAIAAFVTSYARERIRGLIALTGKQHCYYCDTDSLFVDSTGLALLRGANELNETKLGALKIEGASDVATFFGPKDYIFGSKTVMKGIRKIHKVKGPTSFEQDQWEKLPSILKRGGQPYVDIKKVTKTLSREYTKGLLGYRGWTRPFTLNEF